MSGEQQFPTGRVSAEYQQQRDARSKAPTPSPTIRKYDLSQMRDWERWEDHMRSTEAFDSENIEGMLAESLAQDAPAEKRIYVDRNRSYLLDERKILKNTQPEDEYVAENDRWDTTTIVFRDWSPTPFTRIGNAERHRAVARSRDIYIYPDATQDNIRDSVLATAGAGVGGATTYLWALSGGENFRIADPGDLGPHKLNRFVNGDIGELEENQALLLTKQIYDVNPYATVTVYPGGISENEEDGTIPLREFYEGATFGIEAMDNLPLKLQAREIMMQLEVPVVMPTDLNREGFVGFNDNVLGRMDEVVLAQLQDPNIEQQRKTEIVIANFVPPDVPPHMIQPLLSGSKAKLPYWPQSGLAAYASAAGTVHTMIDFLEGKLPERAERPILLS